MTYAKDRIHDATDFIRRVVDHPEAFPERFVSIPMDPDLIARVLSREKSRLVRHLQEHGAVDSLHALAAALGRNYPSVSRDVSALVEAGLLTTERHGRTKRIIATGRPVIVA